MPLVAVSPPPEAVSRPLVVVAHQAGEAHQTMKATIRAGVAR
jgi:hypothetical protein